MTAGPARARAVLDHLCVDPAADALDPVAVYGRNAPLGLEIGFGMGQALLDWAERSPDWNLLGLEIYTPGLGALLLGVADRKLENVRAIEAPAEIVLNRHLGALWLDEVRIFFPDPWPKARHHKRRLIQTPFVALLADRLRPGGVLWLATDWAPYADWMRSVMAAEPRFEPLSGSDVPGDRVETRFEARGLRLGHAIEDLRYRRV
ncbi:MAG: tRNA (guanosine(46)-N7)-methyltransferase TrmB [Pseudomonadales bacterium]